MSIQNINAVKNYLKPEKLLPVFYLCGEDSVAIDNALKAIEKTIEPLLASELDKEIINCEKGINANTILDSVSAYPFGSEKKLIVVKNFSALKDKKNLTDYIKSPNDFSVLIITHFEKKPDGKSDPYKSLIENNFCFEAKELKGIEFAGLVISLINSKKKKISLEDAEALVELVGDSRSIIEMQIYKLIEYVGEKDVITLDDIKKNVIATRQNSVFDLLNALGRNERVKALKSFNNLLENGEDINQIIGMLAKFFSIIASSIEFAKDRIPDDIAARKLKTSKYFYQNCTNAKYFRDTENLRRAVSALAKADLELKTSGSDEKTIAAELVSTILPVKGR
ncbi:MAG: DNA polymerase III subunit delta [Melioribacteraceae bacterium]|jgi:DNA polymerase-3 subunit delta|nr:DNA polymerase III subunit delta [Melioribacteraceae bacterium]